MSIIALGLLVGSVQPVGLEQHPHVIPADTFRRSLWNQVKISRLTDDLRTSLHSDIFEVGAHLESVDRCIYSLSTGTLLFLGAQFKDLEFGNFLWNKSNGLTRLEVPREWMLVDYTLRGSLVAALSWRPYTDNENLQNRSDIFYGMLGILYFKDGAWSRPFSVQSQGSTKVIPGFPWASFLSKLALKHVESRERFESYLNPSAFDNSMPANSYGWYLPKKGLFFYRQSDTGIEVFTAQEDLIIRPYCIVQSDSYAMAIRFTNGNLYLLDSDQNFSLVSRSGFLQSSCKVKGIVDIVD